MRIIAISVTALAMALPAPAQQPTAPAKTPAQSSSTATKAPAQSSSTAAKTPAKTPAKSAAKAPAKAVAPPALATPRDKFSYALGVNISQGMKAQSLDIDLNLLLRGLKDNHTGAAMAMTPQEVTEVLTRTRQEMIAREQEQQRIAGEKNKQEGEAFLAQNKARPGVVTLPSGLQYEELRPGPGATPKSTDTVTTHYSGTLINGTEFDSSYKRGQPATFAVTGVIKGWTEALQLMKVGAKWKLYIPSNLAYGEQQRGQHITPNSVLVFEIELLAIKEATPPPTPK